MARSCAKIEPITTPKVRLTGLLAGVQVVRYARDAIGGFRTELERLDLRRIESASIQRRLLVGANHVENFLDRGRGHQSILHWVATSLLSGQSPVVAVAIHVQRCNLRFRYQRHNQYGTGSILDDLFGNTSKQEVTQAMPPVTAHHDQPRADAHGMLDDSGMRATRLGCRGTGDILFSHLGHGTIQLFRGMAQHFRHRHRHGDDIAGWRHDQRRVQVDVEDFKSRVKGSRQGYSGVQRHAG